MVDVITLLAFAIVLTAVKEILKDINLELDNGFAVITGPNGSGKSTLAKIIAGIITPTAGQILLDGVDTGFTNDKVFIHVAVQAIQAYGFENAEKAFSDLPTNPWLEETN